VEGATRAAMKVRPIKEDAGILHEFGNELAASRLSRRTSAPLALELPLVGGETCGGEFDALTIVFVGEVGTVTAAPLD
jgi:hypothetical protein